MSVSDLIECSAREEKYEGSEAELYNQLHIRNVRSMKKFNYYEFCFYVSVGAGLANATSSFMIMSGLFELVRGLWAVLAVAGSGLLCCVIASSVGEQASLFPGSAGLRAYLRASLGNRSSLFLVYNYLAFMLLGAAIEMRLFALVFSAVFPNVPPLAILITLFLVIIGINLLGVEVPRVMQIIAILLVLSGIASLGIAGIFLSPNPKVLLLDTMQSHTLSQAMFLPAAIGMGFFLFVGYEWVTPLGFNPRSYQKLIPYSMFAAVLVTACVAMLFVAGLGAQFVPSAVMKNHLPQVQLAIQLAGNKGKYLALLLCTLATLSTFNAGLIGGARLLYALAREGHFFKSCARVSLNNGVTYGSILLLGTAGFGLSLLMMYLGLEMAAATVASAIVCCIYSALLYSLVRLRKLRPEQKRPYRSFLPLWVCWGLIPVLPLLGLASLFMTPGVGAGAVAGFTLCGLLSLGMTWWFQAANQKSKGAAHP